MNNAFDCKRFSWLNSERQNFNREQMECAFFVTSALLNKKPNMNTNAAEKPNILENTKQTVMYAM